MAIGGASDPVVRRVLVENGVSIRTRRDWEIPSRIDREQITRAVDRGLSVAEIAAEQGVTDRAVRYTLRRLGIVRPAQPRPASPAMVEAYLGGATVAEAGATAGVKHTAARRMLVDAGVRIRSAASRPSSYPQLYDRAWLVAQLEAGVPVLAIARDSAASARPSARRCDGTDSADSSEQVGAIARERGTRRIP